jgi:hypothetical protein
MVGPMSRNPVELQVPIEAKSPEKRLTLDASSWTMPAERRATLSLPRLGI